MCGRYTVRVEGREIAEHFSLDESAAPDLRPRYNVAPSQEVPAVGPRRHGARGVAEFRWGLVPHWADDPEEWPSMINARSETAHEKPAFRDAFARRRCLIPADGFYEWKKGEDGSQPYFVRRRDDELFAFAGLWDRWRGGDGDELLSCAILTTEPSDAVRSLHDRMPVIVETGDYELWLDRSVREREPLERVLRPYDDGRLVHHPVSRRVNSPANDDPGCVEPLEE